MGEKVNQVNLVATLSIDNEEFAKVEKRVRLNLAKSAILLINFWKML